jgi:GH25 family lysozyme M1 (1,4-beta-N-acetylmuramidase)
MEKGIDISYWQGNVDFAKVKNEVDFVILREGYKQTVDAKFFEYIKGCQSHSINIHGVYHFLYPLNNQDVLAEAKSCIANVKKAGLDKSTRIWCDLEYDTIKKAKEKGVTLGKNEINLFTKTFCDYIVSQGYKTGVYTNCDYYKNYYTEEVLNKYPVWLADYSGDPDYDCIMQQYSSKGVVSGISGNVDMNYCFCADAEEINSMVFDPAKVIAIAKAEVGYIEKASNSQLDDPTANPGSANYTKYGRDMHAIYPAIMDFPAAWCDAFVDWCFYKAYGITNAKKLLCGDFDDYTVASANLYKKQGAWHTSDPEAGDQVFFKNSSGICHTGLVESVDQAGFWAIEGNTNSNSGVISNGGMVCQKYYKNSYSRIAGFGRPPYGMVSGYTSTTVSATSSAQTLQAQAQVHLNNFVNANLTIDGVIGTNSKKAFRKALQSALNFDNSAGLTVDGIIGAKTKEALKKVDLCKGCSGHLVTVLEIGMLIYDIDPNGVECPGKFGSGLYTAIGTFQTKNGLTCDHEAGYNTFMKLQA